MKNITSILASKPWLGWVLFFGTMLITFIIGLFASSIMERRSESDVLFQVKKEIPPMETRSEKWQENFPREYNRWQMTSDSSFRSKHGGSAVRDSLEEYPNMVIMWAGYPFAKDYMQARDHFYAVEDVQNTLRTVTEKSLTDMPGTCWTCKSPDVLRVMNDLGNGDIRKGASKFYADKWGNLGQEIANPIGCLDCHDPKTMDLQVKRPAIIEAFERQNINISDIPHNEMRNIACAQCHSEYYFKGEGKYLTFPWDNGTSAEEVEKYYDEIGHVDWVHKISKVSMLKAQHPDFELFNKGIHAQRGLSCADCHMPFISEGGVKFTDHKVQSPLNNIANTCQVCHRESEETLRNSVYERQDKFIEVRRKVENQITRAHFEAGKAWESGATEEEMKDILIGIRHAQWRWDYAVASINSAFHAPVEALRTLSSALESACDARLNLSRVLAKHGVTDIVEIPDISTKEKAQTYLGLDMVALRANKEKFKATLLKDWQKITEERHKKWDMKNNIVSK